MEESGSETGDDDEETVAAGQETVLVTVEFGEDSDEASLPVPENKTAGSQNSDVDGPSEGGEESGEDED